MHNLHVHVNKVLRRILNTSSRLDWSRHVAPVLTDYMGRMKEAGYDERYRKTTLEQALRMHDKMQEDEKDGNRPVNRPKDWRREERRQEKKKKKHNWATRGGCIAPIFIPSTPNGELLNMLREVTKAEAEPGLKFQLLEKGGRTVKRTAQRSNPTAKAGCQAGDCLACKEERGKGGACRRSNVLYRISCNMCPEDDRSVYLGETARNLYTRGREHAKNNEKKYIESFMNSHQNEQHAGVAADFHAEVVSSYRDCLSRQVSEGVHIRRSKEKVLNSKAEWHQPALWRVRNELSRE